MKKHLLTLATVFAFYSASAQNWFPTSGNTGIGTTSPTAMLHISQNTGGVGDYVLQRWDYGTAASTYNLQFKQHIIAGLATWGFDVTNAGVSYPNNLVLNNGNVGIGTATPGSKLVVAPTSSNSSIDQTVAVIQTSGTTAFGGYVGQRVISGNIRQGLIVSGTSSLTLNAQNYNIDFITGAVTPSDDTNLRMRILPTGNVGIGTTNPDQKLTVNGTIHATSVLVNTTIPLPDYVFKPTYQLLTLDAVKTYIDQNHHLPDMPSAAQVEKDGLNLGEMNEKLLKKVEELTLYLIEKDKTEHEQKEINKQQAAQLQLQQAQVDLLIKQVTALLKEKTK